MLNIASNGLQLTTHIIWQFLADLDDVRTAVICWRKFPAGFSMCNLSSQPNSKFSSPWVIQCMCQQSGPVTPSSE